MGKPPYNSARVCDMVHIFVCQPGKCKRCTHGGHFIGKITTGRQGINNRPAARLTDQGVHTCPHGGTFTIIEGDPKVIIEGQPGSRFGDKVICNICGAPGMIMQGSNDTFTEN